MLLLAPPVTGMLPPALDDLLLLAMLPAPPLGELVAELPPGATEELPPAALFCPEPETEPPAAELLPLEPPPVGT